MQFSGIGFATALFGLSDRVRKTKGSSWQGRVVGFYSTSLTPIGYCVESEREPGSVQLYPESALERVPEETLTTGTAPISSSTGVYESVPAAIVDQMAEALKALLRRDEKNTCQHENTHRGGVIWEICDDCGAKWADDEGGKPEWADPKEWTDARAALKAYYDAKEGRDASSSA